MELCDNGHEEICFSVDTCPACELNDQVTELESQKEELEDKVNELDSDLEDIRNECECE